MNSRGGSSNCRLGGGWWGQACRMGDRPSSAATCKVILPL